MGYLPQHALQITTLEFTEEEGFNYLHCTYYTSPKYIAGWWDNIWKTSYLTSNASTDRLQLL